MNMPQNVFRNNGCLDVWVLRIYINRMKGGAWILLRTIIGTRFQRLKKKKCVRSGFEPTIIHSKFTRFNTTIVVIISK